MSVIVIVGAQWGDEGKGKVVDLWALDAFIVARYHGGANAGHTLVIDGKPFVVHLLPSSSFRPNGPLNLVCPGTVCALEVLAGEKSELLKAKEKGGRVMVDRRAHVVHRLHKMLDEAREVASGTSAIGTTRRGIGPAHEDRAARRGPRLQDLTDMRLYRRALTDRHLYREYSLRLKDYGLAVPSVEDLVEEAAQYASIIVPFLGDTIEALHAAKAAGQNILGEGAHGIMLDVDHGTYPFVTSSNCGADAFAVATGIRAEHCAGIVKAYTTRVGAGPFPTEQDNDIGATLREAGREYGSTTGRPRRIGWLDCVQLCYAARLGGLTELVLTRLDILSGQSTLLVCVGYRDGDRIVGPTETLTTELLARVTPTYIELPGWSEDISDCRKRADLPRNARAYVTRVEEATGLPVTMIGVGARPEQSIHC